MSQSFGPSEIQVGALKNTGLEVDGARLRADRAQVEPTGPDLGFWDPDLAGLLLRNLM